jgi:hypothetical protein
MVQKMTVLSKVFGRRPPGATHCRVIAIDGLESQAVDNLVAYLSESFKVRTPYFFRVCQKKPVEMVDPDLQGYSRLITH